MATNFSSTIELNISSVLTNALDLSTPVDSFSNASGSASASFTYSNGTGTDQAGMHWHDVRTVAGTTADDLDLAGSLTTALGTTLTFAKLKEIYIKIVTPATGDKLRFGPRNVANAMQLGFQAATANFYYDFHHVLYLRSPIDGWTVTGGSSDTLGIYNPGATSVTYAIYLVGTV